MNKDIYYRIARDLFLNSFPSYDINEVGIHNPILHTCELYNNSYENILTKWRISLNLKDWNDIKKFNSDIYKNVKKPKII